MKPLPNFPAADAALYERYLRALALLAECAPYVDVEDYRELIDELLDDAQDHYPLVVRRDGDRRELALREAAVRTGLKVTPN